MADDEAVAVAMHVVNAQFASAGMGPTLEMTTKLNRIIGVIEMELGIVIDRDSMRAARFITHLRYLFRAADPQAVRRRIQRGADSVIRAYPEAHHF